jgi:hypothetical protein
MKKGTPVAIAIGPAYMTVKTTLESEGIKALGSYLKPTTA